MANRLWDTAFKTLGKGAVVIKGRFATNSTSSPTAANTKGKGYTVARTATGIYTGTLADKYSDVEGTVVDIQLNSPRAYEATLKSIDPATKAFVIHTTQVSDGALADIAANANNWVSFRFWLKN